jgi:hypothetical protein
VRTRNVGKALFQKADHRRGIVHRQRGLRHVRQPVGVARPKILNILKRLQQRDAAGRQLTHGPDDFRMARVPDEHNFTPAAIVDFGLAMHFGDQRTSRIDREQIAPPGLLRDRSRDAMGGKDHRRVVIGNLTEFLDKNRALGPKTLHDVPVMHDFMAHVDRRSIDCQGAFHGFNGAHHAGAKAPRRTEQDLQDWLGRTGCHFDLESPQIWRGFPAWTWDAPPLHVKRAGCMTPALPLYSTYFFRSS